VAHAYLGIDVGTSGLKAALVDEDGRVVTTTEAQYPVSTPAPDRAESDPREWTAAAAAAAAGMAAQLAHVTVAAIGISGQMHGAVLCDESGRPVASAILWLDRRASVMLDRWRRLPERRLAALGNPPAPGMTGPVLAWLTENRPELINDAAAVLQAKDVVRHALTSHPANALPLTDRSDASATLLWDVPADNWAEDVAEAVGVPTRLLPAASPSARAVGRTDWLSRTVPGATDDVAVAAGAGDTPAALLAIGAAGLHVNLGTGAQVIVRRPAAAPVRGGHTSTHLYADAADGWYAMAALQNGGLALEHSARLLGLSWGEMVAAAARGRPGAVTFLPFFTGERGGVASPASLGGWLDVGIDTTQDDLARAAVEGVMFAVRRGVELLGPVPDAEPVVTLSGGGWRSDLLVRLAADVLGRPVRRIGLRSASAVGAAMLAAQCAGTELIPERRPDSVVDPADSPQLEGAYRRWLARSRSA
jgi:xylulokinase